MSPCPVGPGECLRLLQRLFARECVRPQAPARYIIEWKQLDALPSAKQTSKLPHLLRNSSCLMMRMRLAIRPLQHIRLVRRCRFQHGGNCTRRQSTGRELMVVDLPFIVRRDHRIVAAFAKKVAAEECADALVERRKSVHSAHGERGVVCIPGWGAG